MADSTIVHARLDAKTERILRRLRRHTGLSDSELVRRGLEALAVSQVKTSGARFIGVGAFDSGVGDLATNEDHLRGFGES